MVGNGLPPLINVACLRLERVVKLAKTISETNANKGKSRPMPSYDILGAGMLWKPKEARILTNCIDQPVNIW
jgi:hypothetical protein